MPGTSDGSVAARGAATVPKPRRGTPENLAYMHELRDRSMLAPTNGRPLAHGGKSKVKLEPVTQQKVEDLKAFLQEHGARWMTRADEPLIVQTARQLVLVDQMWSYLTVRGVMDTHGRPRGVMKMWFTAQNTLTRQLSALGCSPLARAELGANLAASKLDAAQAMRFSRPRAERVTTVEPTSELASVEPPKPE